MRTIVLGVLVGIMACGPRVEVDEGDASGSGSATTGDTPGDPSDSSGSADAETGGPPDPPESACASAPNFACPDGVDCSVYPCGDPFSWYDENGCLRSPCPCPEGQVCFTPAQWGGCESTEIQCGLEADGFCECGGSKDCAGRYCLPVEQIPEAPCLNFDGPADCDAANCLWVDGWRVAQTDACSCDPRAGMCVSPVEVFPVPEALSYYRLDRPNEAISFEAMFEPIPFGLAPCDAESAAAGCQCAAQTPCF